MAKAERAFLGLNVEEPRPIENEDVARPGDGGGDRRSVAGLVGADGPEGLPARGVESDDAPFFSADVEDDAVPFDKRRSRGAEEARLGFEFLVGVDAPELFPRRELEPVERPLRAKDEDAAAGDGGRGAGAVVVAVAVAIIGRVVEAPDLRSALGREALDAVLVPDAVEKNHAPTGDGGPGVSLPRVMLPEEGGPFSPQACASEGPA